MTLTTFETEGRHLEQVVVTSQHPTSDPPKNSTFFAPRQRKPWVVVVVIASHLCVTMCNSADHIFF